MARKKAATKKKDKKSKAKRTHRTRVSQTQVQNTKISIRGLGAQAAPLASTAVYATFANPFPNVAVPTYDLGGGFTPVKQEPSNFDRGSVKQEPSNRDDVHFGPFHGGGVLGGRFSDTSARPPASEDANMSDVTVLSRYFRQAEWVKPPTEAGTPASERDFEMPDTSPKTSGVLSPVNSERMSQASSIAPSEKSEKVKSERMGSASTQSLVKSERMGSASPSSSRGSTKSAKPSPSVKSERMGSASPSSSRGSTKSAKPDPSVKSERMGSASTQSLVKSERMGSAISDKSDILLIREIPRDPPRYGGSISSGGLTSVKSEGSRMSSASTKSAKPVKSEPKTSSRGSTKTPSLKSEPKTSSRGSTKTPSLKSEPRSSSKASSTRAYSEMSGSYYGGTKSSFTGPQLSGASETTGVVSGFYRSRSRSPRGMYGSSVGSNSNTSRLTVPTSSGGSRASRASEDSTRVYGAGF